MKTVVIVHNNKKYEVSKMSMSNSRRFIDDYYGVNQIVVNDEYTDEQFSLFIRFLETGEFDTGSNCAYNIFSILNDWRCNSFVIKDFKSQMLMKDNDFLIMHDNVQYPTNLGLVIMASQVIKDHFTKTSSFCFEIPKDFSKQCVACILDLIHNRNVQPVIEMYSEVRELAEFLDCQSIKKIFITENSKDLVTNLRKIQNKGNVDTNDLEKTIALKIENYITTKEFAQLPIPSLIRILSQAKYTLKKPQISSFFENVISIHGTSASMLISIIKLSLNDEEMIEILELLSTQGKMEIFDKAHDLIIKTNCKRDQQKEIDTKETTNLKRQIQILQSKMDSEIASLKNEHEKLIKSLKSCHAEEISDLKQKIEDVNSLKNIVREKDNIASELAKKIQGKDKEIMRLKDELDSKENEKCTYVKTRRNHAIQPWFHCRTCGLVGNLGCCHVCVKNCHSGHEVTYAGLSSCYCDCAETGKCKCCK